MALLLVALVLLGSVNANLEIYNVYETSVAGPSDGNPFKDIVVTSTFIAPSKKEITINGYYDGSGIYKFRFMPNELGHWKYFTNSNNPNVEDKTGDFQVTNATSTNKGPVIVKQNINTTKERAHFIYMVTNETYFESGTTSYGWTEGSSSMTSKTINTIKYLYTNNIFNKIRMTILPIYGSWQHIEPDLFPYTGSMDNNWNNYTEFNVTFWQQFDSYITQLQDIGIIIDLILFHPYDKWGFKCMGGKDMDTYDTSNDIFYLKYVIARYGAFRNIWWSMGNEFDRVGCKAKGINNSVPDDSTFPIWDELFEGLVKYDANFPLREKSIHQGMIMYNYSREWVTHFSVQCLQNVDYKYYLNKYNVVNKPIVLDEVQYEGNLSAAWGNLTAIEELDRFWMGTSLGVMMGHSECLLPNDIDNTSATAITWWNYGVELKGESYMKIKWLNSFMRDITIHPPFENLFTHCYVDAVYNFWNSDYQNVSACYVSQLYDLNGDYYMVRFQNITENNSVINYDYNTTVNIMLKDGEYVMSRIEEWNEKIITINESVKVTGNNGYLYTAKTLPMTIQFVNKNSRYY